MGEDRFRELYFERDPEKLRQAMAKELAISEDELLAKAKEAVGRYLGVVDWATANRAWRLARQTPLSFEVAMQFVELGMSDEDIADLAATFDAGEIERILAVMSDVRACAKGTEIDAEGVEGGDACTT